MTSLLHSDKSNIKPREDKDGMPFLENLAESITSVEQVMELLDTGLRKRKLAATNMNDNSSRSHTLFRIHIESRETGSEGTVCRVAELNLVDLAGSERASQTGAEGARLKEGGFINKSLFILSNVIQKLGEGASHVPFRESKVGTVVIGASGGFKHFLFVLYLCFSLNLFVVCLLVCVCVCVCFFFRFGFNFVFCLFCLWVSVGDG